MYYGPTMTNDRIDGSFFGVPISVKGLNMAIVLMLATVTGFFIYFLSVMITGRLDNFSREHSAIADALREQNYILLADEQETAKIRQAYRMPPSLREKLNGTQP